MNENTPVYTDEKWLIWSIEHNGWWAPAERGYVHNKDDAGVYSYERACEIVAGANRDMQRPYEAMVKIEVKEKKNIETCKCENPMFGPVIVKMPYKGICVKCNLLVEFGPFDMCIDPESCKRRGDSCTGMCQLNTHHEEE